MLATMIKISSPAHIIPFTYYTVSGPPSALPRVRVRYSDRYVLPRCYTLRGNLRDQLRGTSMTYER